MIGTEVIQDFGRIDRLSELARVYPTLPQSIGQSILDKRKANLLAEVSYTPPVFKGKRTWTSEKQRRAFFATNGFGRGIPYKRTGKLNKSWEVFLVDAPGGIAVRLSNTTPYAQFVVGRVKPRGKDPMQVMHKITGWKPVSPLFAVWAETLAQDVVLALQVVLEKRGL